jgi:hypothetical protein
VADGETGQIIVGNMIAPTACTVTESPGAYTMNAASSTCDDITSLSPSFTPVNCTFVNDPAPNTITIVKDSIPNDAQDFSFSATSPINGFSLDDDSDGTLPNQMTFAAAPGSYSVQESGVSGWDLTGLACVTTDGSDTSNVDLSSSLVTIDLDANENITCTFTNTKRGTITVVKDAEPADGTDFTISLGGDGAGSILLDDIEPQDGDVAQSSETFAFVPGNYTLTEEPLPGWTLDDLTCTTSDTGEPVDETGDVATINLDAGEDVTCTFTNTGQQGTITIVKDATPDDAQDFSFSGNSPLNSFSLDDDADGTLPNQESFIVPVGSYSVQEIDVSGWDLTAITCVTDDAGDTSSVDLSNNLVTIDVDADEDITCTFTNTKRGTITVVKDAEPADGTDFTISLGGDGAGNILLDDIVPQDGDVASTQESFTFVPGNYTLTEVEQAGWALASLACSTSDSGEPVVVTPNLATIALDAAEEVTCTFTNLVDQDSDGVADVDDNCPAISNPGQENIDGDALGDACDPVNDAASQLRVIKHAWTLWSSHRFDLLIDDVLRADNVSNGGSTGWVPVSAAVHKVSEEAGPNTNLASYATLIKCYQAGRLTPIAIGIGRSVNVNVPDNTAVTCIVLNMYSPFRR